MTRPIWTAADLDRLGVRTDLATAAAVLGVGLTKARELVRAGAFPVPVLRLGHRYVVPVAGLRRLLAVDSDGPARSVVPAARDGGAA